MGLYRGSNLQILPGVWVHMCCTTYGGAVGSQIQRSTLTLDVFPLRMFQTVSSKRSWQRNGMCLCNQEYLNGGF